MASSDEIPPSLEADFVALRKLREDDASGVLKKYLGDSEDPLEWKDEDGARVITEVKDGRVAGLQLYKCSIGKADELTLGQVDEEPAAPAPAAPKGKEDPEETQTVSQEQIKELEERLNKLETANASCKCAIA